MKRRSHVTLIWGCLLGLLVLPGQAMSIAGYDVWTYQFPGAPITGFRDINADGDVVGYYQTNASDFNTAQALEIVGGVAQTITIPTATSDRRAFGNNDAGDVAGSFNNLGSHSFVRSGGVFTTIDFPGTTQGTTIRGLNNLGDLAGEYDDSSGQHGFVRRISGVFQTVDVPGATTTTVRAINDAGRMAGFYTDSSGQAHGFVSDDGVAFTTIDHPDPTALSTLAGGINNDGVVAGVWLASPGSPESQPARGFLLDSGVYTPFDLAGAVSTIPLGINDSGQIAGEAVASDGTHYGFIATPVPSPGSGVVILIGLTAVLRRGAANRPCRQRLSQVQA
ncbi:MAG: hypothetical protein KTR15_14320 [Phycisphaeraceae bacterium]|nr:hypothetical protein [Phycisphaeraceae bacterium]